MYIKQCSTRLNRCRCRRWRWKRFHERVSFSVLASAWYNDGARLLFIILLAHSHILSAVQWHRVNLSPMVLVSSRPERPNQASTITLVWDCSLFRQTLSNRLRKIFLTNLETQIVVRTVSSIRAQFTESQIPFLSKFGFYVSRHHYYRRHVTSARGLHAFLETGRIWNRIEHWTIKFDKNVCPSIDSCLVRWFRQMIQTSKRNSL